MAYLTLRSDLRNRMIQRMIGRTETWTTDIPPLSSLTVFCGASFGHGELAQRCAVELGRLLADSGVTLVYGGASTGLMGMLADSVIEHEGQVA